MTLSVYIIFCVVVFIIFLPGIISHEKKKKRSLQNKENDNIVNLKSSVFEKYFYLKKNDDFNKSLLYEIDSMVKDYESTLENMIDVDMKFVDTYTNRIFETIILFKKNMRHSPNRKAILQGMTDQYHNTEEIYSDFTIKLNNFN